LNPCARFPFYFLFSFFLAIVSSAVESAVPRSGGGGVPVYAVLVGADVDSAEEVLNSGCLDGITVYIGWRRIEPKRGSFQFERIEHLIELARKKKKKINFAFLAGRWSPGWLKGLNVQYVNWDHADIYVEDGVERASSAPIPSLKLSEILLINLMLLIQFQLLVDQIQMALR
jgi:hypothetical protein